VRGTHLRGLVHWTEAVSSTGRNQLPPRTGRRREDGGDDTWSACSARCGAHGVEAPYSVEVISDALLARGLDTAADLARAAARKVLAAV
jgi:hypothetical protein